MLMSEYKLLKIVIGYRYPLGNGGKNKNKKLLLVPIQNLQNFDFGHLSTCRCKNSCSDLCPGFK